MKNTNWRRIALISSMSLFGVIMFGAGFILAQYMMASWAGNIIERVLQLSPEDAAGLFNKFMQSFSMIIRKGA